VFASIAMILTATATTIGAMNNFFTLFIFPMFYLSGVWFPLERLPHGLQTAAWAFPLTPAAALVRGLVRGEPSWPMLLWALELAGFLVVVLPLASFLMRRRLIK
jgi:lipooligosaccharide transport system permease protein